MAKLHIDTSAPDLSVASKLTNGEWLIHTTKYLPEQAQIIHQLLVLKQAYIRAWGKFYCGCRELAMEIGATGVDAYYLGDC